MKLIKTQAEMS